MPDDDDKTLQLRALVALDQERGRTDDLSFAFLTEYKARARAEEQLRAFLAGDRLIEQEVREQLATSELMRAELSRELQITREQLMLCRELATGAIGEELAALEELDKLHYLNEFGRNRMETLKSWLLIYGVD